MQSLSTKFVTNMVFITAIQEFTNKENEMANEKKRINSLKEKSLPNCEIKWKHENFVTYKCVCIISWNECILQFN